MTTPPLFDVATATKLSGEDTAAAAKQFGETLKRKKTESTLTDFLPVSAPQNHTGQTFTGVHAIVIGASDAKLGERGTPTLKLSAFVRGVCDDLQDPVFDLVNSNYQIPVVKAQGGEVKQYPRYIPDGDVRMVPVGCFVDVSIFPSSNSKDAPLSASDLPIGTHVKLTGLTANAKSSGCEPRFPRPHGPSHHVLCVDRLYLNAKSVVVVRDVEDIFEGMDALQAGFSNTQTSLAMAMAACSLLGGVKNVLAQASYLGTKLYTHLHKHQSDTAAALESLAARMEGKVIGEGETWSSPVLCKKPLQALAQKIIEGDLSVGSISGYGAPVPLPLLFEARKPWDVHPPRVQDLLVSETDNEFTTAASMVLVDVAGSLCKMYASLLLSPPRCTALVTPSVTRFRYYNVAVGLTGEGGVTALAYGQKPLLRGEGPVGLLKQSMKNIAIRADTRSMVKATMAAKEILPHARIVTVVPARLREWGDRAFSDGDWGLKTVIDFASGIRAAGLPVSSAFCREFAGGESIISEFVPDSKDTVDPPIGPDAPSPVRLK